MPKKNIILFTYSLEALQEITLFPRLECLALHLLSLGGINKYLPVLLHFRANILLHEELGGKKIIAAEKILFPFLFLTLDSYCSSRLVAK